MTDAELDALVARLDRADNPLVVANARELFREAAAALVSLRDRQAKLIACVEAADAMRDADTIGQATATCDAYDAARAVLQEQK